MNADSEKGINDVAALLNFTDIKFSDSDENMGENYKDRYATQEQQSRDRQISNLLELYVKGYENKVRDNRRFKRILVILCSFILASFSVLFFIFVLKIDFNSESVPISNLVQLVSVCVTFISLIVGLLQIITKYLFPEKEEEYITRIVELIQQNDLENKKENIRVNSTKK